MTLCGYRQAAPCCGETRFDLVPEDEKTAVNYNRKEEDLQSVAFLLLSCLTLLLTCFIG